MTAQDDATESSFDPRDGIFIGEVLFTTDDILLRADPPNPLYIVLGREVNLTPPNPIDFDEGTFHQQPVSMLAHVECVDLGDGRPVPSLIASHIVLKSDIALLAWKISQSPSHHSSEDDWLTAERLLLLRRNTP
jgi:hypothetical protein